MVDIVSDTQTNSNSLIPYRACLPQAAGQGAASAGLAAVAAPASCRAYDVPALPVYPSPPIRLLRLPEVMARVGIKRALIYQRMAEGTFPKNISLGGNAVAWLESEIDAWVSARIMARR